MMSSLPLFLPILASALLHQVVVFGRRTDHERRQTKWKRFGFLGVTAVLLWALPPHSFTCWWKPTTLVLCQWPLLVKSTITASATENTLVQTLIRGGPLGPGCGKVCEIVAACLLWILLYSDEPLPIVLGPMSRASTWAIVALLSLLVNITLSIWSKQSQSRGSHEGVNSMVESTLGRKLNFMEHIKLAGLAFLNAICEEVASRGFWYHEFQQKGQLSQFHANLVQAVCFGIWHYYGIPSGWTGVGLTFVYGLIMGLLYEYDGQGLLLPVLAHAVADYYIFAIIARQEKQASRTEKSRKQA